MHKGFVGWLQGSWGLRWEGCSTRVHAMLSLERASRSMLKQVFFIVFSLVFIGFRASKGLQVGPHVGPRLGRHLGGVLGAILGGFWEAKTRPRRIKMAPRRVKMAPRRPKMAPRRAKEAPRRLKMAPRRSKTAPGRSKSVKSQKH